MRPFGALMETKPSTFENTWRVSTFGAFHAAQQVVPAMLHEGSGSDPVHGSDAWYSSPFPTSAAFGPAKFAMRGLAHVMARNINQGNSRRMDATSMEQSICPPIRERFPHLKPEDMLKPFRANRGDLLVPSTPGPQRLDARHRRSSL